MRALTARRALRGPAPERSSVLERPLAPGGRPCRRLRAAPSAARGALTRTRGVPPTPRPAGQANGWASPGDTPRPPFQKGGGQTYLCRSGASGPASRKWAALGSARLESWRAGSAQFLPRAPTGTPWAGTRRGRRGAAYTPGRSGEAASLPRGAQEGTGGLTRSSSPRSGHSPCPGLSAGVSGKRPGPRTFQVPLAFSELRVEPRGSGFRRLLRGPPEARHRRSEGPGAGHAPRTTSSARARGAWPRAVGRTYPPRPWCPHRSPERSSCDEHGPSLCPDLNSGSTTPLATLPNLRPCFPRKK